MRVTLISPRLAVQKYDFLGSGVPYWPVELATFAAVLRDAGEDVSVLDLFGIRPGRLTDAGDHYLQGVPIEDFSQAAALRSADAFVVYAISYMSHREIVALTRFLKHVRPGVPVSILENSQAVTGYSLPRVFQPLAEAGADALICGEPHFNWTEIRSFLREGGASPPANVMTRDHTQPPARIISKGARYPIPAWDLFPLEGYWSLPYSHGPKTGRFLPILTSRGCPWPCDFCVVPETNDRRWRGNAPADVVDEIIALRDRFGVRDFQVEDLNPTVNNERFEEICRLLIARNAGIRFYLVSGTKAETMHVNNVTLYAAAGCRYVSISPESGSPRLMQVIGKSFDYAHALALVGACRKHGIRTQACFLVGHPAEEDDDFRASESYLRSMVRAGLDEAAVFIVSSFAGSALYAQGKIAIDSADALPSFSPKGRAGHAELAARRRALIRAFFVEKLRRGADLWLQGLRAVFGTPQTKMENLPRRLAYVMWSVLKARVVG
jgi:anaerobic magnesium-protoporphyrin IX monomethyl ester cyclase